MKANYDAGFRASQSIQLFTLLCAYFQLSGARKGRFLSSTEKNMKYTCTVRSLEDNLRERKQRILNVRNDNQSMSTEAIVHKTRTSIYFQPRPTPPKSISTIIPKRLFFALAPTLLAVRMPTAFCESANQNPVEESAGTRLRMGLCHNPHTVSTSD